MWSKMMFWPDNSSKLKVEKDTDGLVMVEWNSGQLRIWLYSPQFDQLLKRLNEVKEKESVVSKG